MMVEMSRYLGLGKESAFGEPSTPTRFVDPLRIDVACEKEPILRRTVASRFPLDKAPGNVIASGEIEVQVDPETIGDFLLMLLGEVEVSQPDPTGAPSVYAHTFTACEIGEIPPTYTLEIGFDGSARRIISTILESLKLELAPGEYVSATAGILGQKEEQSTPQTPSFPSARSWHSGDATIMINDVQAELRALSMEINNNPSTDHHVIGSRYLTRHELGDLETTGSMDVRFLDRSLLDSFLNDEEASIKIILTGDEIEAGYRNKLELELPRIVYSAWSGEMSGSEPIVQSIDFAALKPSSGDVIKVTLTNQVPSY